MDQNKDGVIDKSDLKDLYAMMGKQARKFAYDAAEKTIPNCRSNSERLPDRRYASRARRTAEFYRFSHTFR